ncbi:hypothetical protein R4P47_03295 [Rhodococcus sp. IEGM 1370]|uniref:hypothetical protein n=1 Tax=unclassified Rhodococcus (in: high G+C Gram-positive bacteria) TaxID=192944 RepID=UPI000B9ACA0A|nr:MULTISPECIES: hypothetical protein [unclassified Rhodococcus (in: high G+C Gram-positive bacteria)]KAA0928204.1 hypothetical protein FQ188_03845 [Rhodococcus sp. ANT_H53B]MDV8075575.1 hypothetical protein [Rhodococcus sp. IEGM 1370]OZF40102.1 hypothetical protein CH295_00390 [Rhodococcus sp. 14-2483-1-2]
MRTIIVSALGLLTLAVLVTALLTTRSTGEQTPLPAPIVAPAAPVQSAPGTPQPVPPLPGPSEPTPTPAPQPVAPDGFVPPPPLPPADWDDDFDDDWDDDDDD